MTRQEILAVAKPILFNTEMVRAILEGRKTVTRRVVKTAAKNLYKGSGGLCGVFEERPIGDKVDLIKPPLKVGDLLYVQETWCCTKYNNMDGDLPYGVKYRADGGDAYFEFYDNERYEKFGKYALKNGWQSPYFMPKEAARIFLRVTDVRCERLQDITEEQAAQEGVQRCQEPRDVFSGAIEAQRFQDLWDSTIKPDNLPLYSWNANPWVWVYQFERIEPK